MTNKLATSLRTISSQSQHSASFSTTATVLASEVNASGSTAAKSSSLKPSPAATPYHPFVHLPLLTFTPSALPPTIRPVIVSNPDRPIVPLPSNLFNVPSRPSLLHKLVISHLASLRQGNASTKNRSEVNYSGKKIRPQKGTGNARLGSRGSPMLIGGGRAFGPRTKGPDGWKRKLNRKEERLGLCVALSEKWRNGALSIVQFGEETGNEIPSTRMLAQKLKSRGWADAVFILGESSPSAESDWLEKSSRNLLGVTIVKDAAKLGIWELLKRKKVIVELSALDSIVSRLDPESNWDQENEEYDEDAEDGEVGEELDNASMARELEEALKEIDLSSDVAAK